MNEQAEQAKQQAEQFFSLGREGGGRADWQWYAKQQCYIKTLEIDDQHAQAWHNLGGWGGGSVGGQQYTKQQCYDRRDEIRPAA